MRKEKKKPLKYLMSNIYIYIYIYKLMFRDNVFGMIQV